MGTVLVLVVLGLGTFLWRNVNAHSLIWVWWKSHPMRWYCRRFRKHSGDWAIITRPSSRPGKALPVLATCQRCYAIAEFDIHNRRITFE